MQLSLPGQICCFPGAFQLLSPMSAAFPCSGSWAEQSPGAWLEKGLCRADTGSSPLCCDPALLLPSPGQCFSCRGCSRWRGCPAAGGTAINSLCPGSSVPHREQGMAPSGPSLSPWKSLALGPGSGSGFCSLVPDGLEKGQKRGYWAPKSRQVL